MYIAQKKAGLRLKNTESYLSLIHHPGETQTDFGTANFYKNGRHYYEAKYLVLSFPYNNGGYHQLNYSENMECLLLNALMLYLLKSSLVTSR